jgi:hypothetical protein
MSRFILAMVGVAGCPFMIAGFLFDFIAAAFNHGRKAFQNFCVKTLKDSFIDSLDDD